MFNEIYSQIVNPTEYIVKRDVGIRKNRKATSLGMVILAVGGLALGITSCVSDPSEEQIDRSSIPKTGDTFETEGFTVDQYSPRLILIRGGFGLNNSRTQRLLNAIDQACEIQSLETQGEYNIHSMLVVTKAINCLNKLR